MPMLALPPPTLEDSDCHPILGPGAGPYWHSIIGDAAYWPAGRTTGHCLQDRSGADASCLTVGIRNATDVIHYPDHDLITHKDGPARRYTRADGTPAPFRRTTP